MDQLDERKDLSIGILTGQANVLRGMDLKAFLRGEQVAIPGRGLAGSAPGTTEETADRGGSRATPGGWLRAGAGLRMVSRLRTQVRIPEVKRGLIAGGGGLLRLPRRIPQNLAMEYALTGDFFLRQRRAAVRPG